MSISFLLFLCLLFISFNHIYCFFRYDDYEEEEQVNCKCISKFLCSDNVDVHGDGVFDIRFEDETPNNNECPNPYEICCEKPIDDEITKCGYPSTFLPRITQDSEIVNFGELPWTVLVLQKNKRPERNSFICGGSLIHPKVIITAGHCIIDGNKQQIVVRAGEWDIKDENEILPHQDRQVADVIIHPHYKSGILWNDIALLILKDTFNIARNIGFICLPPIDLKLEDNKCIASGWGRNGLQRGRHSTVLRKVILPLVPRNKCQTFLRNTRLGKHYRLHKSFICAGGEKNRDTCKGDGGSPLICPIPNEQGRFVQVGIVSWGIGCGANKTPGVYVNLLMYISWIDEQMLKRNLTVNYYKF